MSMLSDGEQWLLRRGEECLAEEVLYLPAGGEAIRVKAVPGRSLFRAEDADGLTVEIAARDFTIAMACLPREPRKGDAILFRGARFEVLPPAGEPCWRWSGMNRTAIRIHTKETKKE